jgi:hypothetical protein
METKYLVRLKIGTKNRVRDGRDLSAPMRDVTAFVPVLFDNLPRGCTAVGNDSFEIVPVNSESELRLWEGRIAAEQTAAKSAADERLKRTKEKIALQMRGGIKAKEEKEAKEVEESLKPPGPATLGAVLEAEGKEQAEVPKEEAAKEEDTSVTAKPATGRPVRKSRPRGR